MLVLVDLSVQAMKEATSNADRIGGALRSVETAMIAEKVVTVKSVRCCECCSREDRNGDGKDVRCGTERAEYLLGECPS